MDKRVQTKKNEQGPKTWPKVAIIILNWNGWQDTIECLESVCQLDYPNYLTIVIDNCSWDDSVERIRSWAQGNMGVIVEYIREEALQRGKEEQEEILERAPSDKRMVLIKNEDNLGFTGGNNIGIHYALQRKYPADFVFLLNNDAQPERDCLTKLVEVAHKSDAGIVGAGQTIGRYDLPQHFEITGLTRCFFSPIVRSGFPPPNTGDDFRLSDVVCGAAMLIKKEALNTIYASTKQYLNEGLFCYCDELDLCAHVKRIGYKIVIAKQARIFHEPAQSTGGSYNPIFYYYVRRNQVLLAKKLLPQYWQILYHPVNIVLCLARVLKNIIYRRPISAWAILCGVMDGYRGVTGKWKYQDQYASKRKYELK